MRKKLVIIIKNPKQLGLITYYNFLKRDFKGIKIYKNLKKNKINFLIENFTSADYLTYSRIKNKYPKTKIVLILTEFFNDSANTLNSFEYKSKLYIYINYLFYKFFIILNNIRLILKKRLGKVKKIQNFKPKGKITFKKKVINFLFQRMKIGYFKNRFNLILKILKISDYIIISHPEIRKSKFLTNLNQKIRTYPYQIHRSKKKNKSFFIISGLITNYRKKFYTNILLNCINDPKFKFIKNILINNVKFYDRYNLSHGFKYALHAKSSSSWKFSSPLRIIDSLDRNEVPIIFDKFKDNFLNHFCIKWKNNYRFINNLERNYSSIFKKQNKLIKEFNKNQKKYFKLVKSEIEKI